MGNGYQMNGALYTKEQSAGWKKIVDTVHSEGSALFVQLAHCGRVASPTWLGGQAPLAPSALAVKEKIHGGAEDYPVPK